MLPTFPQFAELSLNDKNSYDQLIAAYPPFSDISFTTLHIWWNLEGKLSVSSLNQNLVINYSLRFDPKNSGYSLVGKEAIDTSIAAIFDYLAQQHKPQRLVHVPEFVVEQIRQKDKFSLEEELDYHEYVVSAKELASLDHPSHGRTRRKVGRFLREVDNRQVEIKPLDLSSEQSRQLLMDSLARWETAHPKGNDPEGTEKQALHKSLSHADQLAIKHLGLYVDGRLHAIVLYHQPHNKNYYIINHLKVDYSIPFIFDYMTHHIASKAMAEGVEFMNMEMDLGIEGLRRHKMGLRPVNFFKKYTITPSVE